MATKAHCAFCFECLAASFEHRQPLSLSQVEELWEQKKHHHATKSNADDEATVADVDDPDTASSAAARPAGIARLLNHDEPSAASSSSSSLPSSTGSTASSSSSPLSDKYGVSASTTPASSSNSLPGKDAEFPLFVTWNTISRSDGSKSLRGCIGTFAAQKLEEGLSSYALTSAFEDDRFNPIPASQLSRLSNHVTLLTNFSTPTSDPFDWTLGKHGIRIAFTLRGRRYNGTYLPDVAKEQGWTQDETMLSLMRKAGWSGGSSWQNAWREGKGELVRYEGKQVGLSYGEWIEWRDWVDGLGVERKRLN